MVPGSSNSNVSLMSPTFPGSPQGGSTATISAVGNVVAACMVLQYLYRSPRKGHEIMRVRIEIHERKRGAHIRRLEA
ncbi:hypothetical protein K439DRAFT_1633996 [Ramaria rubella]|nr:hypothetical protein K439DRAFT_1633996 [Ramaria rubella]